MGSFQNHTGKSFGNLIAIQYVRSRTTPNGTKRAIWKCKCACGNTKDISATNLKKVKSCGCHYGSFAPDVAARNCLFRAYRANAKGCNREFLLTREEFDVLTKSNCFYCGDEPRQIHKASNYGSREKTCLFNGIDRRDNSLGYIKSNCVSCCIICNRAKGTLSAQVFDAWVERFKNKIKGDSQ